VITQNRHRGSLAYQFYAFIWRPSVPDNVAKAIDLIDSPTVNISQGRQQRLEVRMDIRNHGDLHPVTLMLYRILGVPSVSSSNQDTHFIVSLLSATPLP
jgi:hypothetical protein